MEKSIDFVVQPTDLHHSIYHYSSEINYCLDNQFLYFSGKASYYHMKYCNSYHVIFVEWGQVSHFEILLISL